MENPRPEKVAVVEEVRNRISSSSGAILTEYRGLKVGELAALRRSLRDAGGQYKIYKNTLVRFAVRDLGLDELEAMLTGPTAIAFVDGDTAAVAKALRDYARTNPNLVVKGGVLGANVLTAADANALAELPSREVLLARVAGGLQAPLAKFAGLLQALPRNLAYGLKALIDQKPPEPTAEPPAPEATAPEPAPVSPVTDASAEAAASSPEEALTEAAGGHEEAGAPEPLAESPPAPDQSDTTEQE